MHPLRMVCRSCGGDGQIALTRCGLIVASRTTGSIITTERCEECDGDGWRPWPWHTELVDPPLPSDRPGDTDEDGPEANDGDTDEGDTDDGP